MSTRLLALASWILLSCGTGSVFPELPDAAEKTTQRTCSSYSPTRNVFWGDLHVHTGLSRDAYRSDVRTTPDDAYRFARGESLRIPPMDTQGRMTQEVWIDRPLDFTAVTDHAEGMGVMAICADPDHPDADSEWCNYFRQMPAHQGYPHPEHLPPVAEIFAGICGGEEHPLCNAARASTWDIIRQAAARWNDTSKECRFTTFVAYEWSGARGGPLLHRNVIFRNAEVPLPVSSQWDPTPHHLWRKLERECLQAGTGCDVLAIPHNSNTSQSAMFVPEYPGATTLEEEARQAARRRDLEPLVEVMQHKGDSECDVGVRGVFGTPDELCGFEKLFGDAPQCDDLDLATATQFQHCKAPSSYARTALAIGLAEEARIGVNPFELGFIAATDTHNATSGAVAESGWKGAVGDRDDSWQKRLGPSLMLSASNNPGGLAAVWAEENSRDSLFQAMRRREVYGTSGPRMTVRFFGGFDYAEDLCDQPDLIQRGYAGGVPMGGELIASKSNVPTFLVTALRDPGTPESPGAPLQRIQIVKVWPDVEGDIQQRVIDVAGHPADAAQVDPATCEPTGPGSDQLCSVWRDPEFDSAQPVAYYARVIENPTCRWSQLECLGLPEAERPPACTSGELEVAIQERAWTSPIWVTPSGS